MIYFAEVIKDGHTKDPGLQGRCKVRCYTRQDNEQSTKDEDLSLALPLLEPTSASIAGMGKVPTGLLPGSRVAITHAENDVNKQFPIIMGSWPRGFKPVVSQNENDSNQDSLSNLDQQTKGFDLPTFAKPDKDCRCPANPRVNKTKAKALEV